MTLHALGSVDPQSLVDSRLQLHHAVQTLAAFGGALITPRADDSHRTVNWNPHELRFYSQDADGLRAFAAPDRFAIGLVRDGQDLATLPLMGATLRTARSWMEKAVQDARGDTDFALAWPGYELPSHRVLDGQPFQPKAASMRELSQWFSGATTKLGVCVDQEDDVEPVRTWPHHFDIATLIVLGRDDDSVPTQTVGVGMTPGDADTTEPYWYVNAWGFSKDAALPELHTPGHTHREGWSGFMLTATELIDAGRQGRADPAGEGDRQKEALDGFLERAIGAAKALFAV